MSSKIKCESCKRVHDPIPSAMCSLLIAYCTQMRTGKPVFIDPTDPAVLGQFLEACMWIRSAENNFENYKKAPAWASNTVHFYDPPLVHSLEHATKSAEIGDAVIFDGAERIWDGSHWCPGAPRSMPLGSSARSDA